MSCLWYMPFFLSSSFQQMISFQPQPLLTLLPCPQKRIQKLQAEVLLQKRLLYLSFTEVSQENCACLLFHGGLVMHMEVVQNKNIVPHSVKATQNLFPLSTVHPCSEKCNIPTPLESSMDTCAGFCQLVYKCLYKNCNL